MIERFYSEAFLWCFYFLLQSDVNAEIEQLRQELRATVSMYERTCGELVQAQNKVSDCY